MADLPEHLDLARHRDHKGTRELVARRVVMGLLAALAVAALLEAFGQSARTSSAAAERATLEVSAPPRLRGGLFFQGKFTVRAQGAIENATLVLAPGWMENTHINTIEPAPTEEASRDGDLALSFGPLATSSSSTCSSRSTRRTSAAAPPTSPSTTATSCSPASTAR